MIKKPDKDKFDERNRKFLKKFRNKRECEEYLFMVKGWPDNYKCLNQKENCKSNEFYKYIKKQRKRSRVAYQCKQCKHQVFATKGTIFEKSRIPLKKFFYLIFLVSQRHFPLSAVQIKKRTKIKSYKTVLEKKKEVLKLLMRDQQKLLSIVHENDLKYWKKKRNKYREMNEYLNRKKL